MFITPCLIFDLLFSLLDWSTLAQEKVLLSWTLTSHSVCVLALNKAWRLMCSGWILPRSCPPGLICWWKVATMLLSSSRRSPRVQICLTPGSIPHCLYTVSPPASRKFRFCSELTEGPRNWPEIILDCLGVLLVLAWTSRETHNQDSRFDSHLGRPFVKVNLLVVLYQWF